MLRPRQFISLTVRSITTYDPTYPSAKKGLQGNNPVFGKSVANIDLRIW